MLKPLSHFVIALSLAAGAVCAETAPAVTGDAAQQQAMQHLLHANPLPNYMAVARKNADKLSLTAEQKAALDDWFNTNNANSMAVVRAIVAAEEALAAASLQGVAKDQLMAQFDEMVQMRRALAAAKTDCRDHMQKVLSSEQWVQLLAMQQAAMK